MRKFTLPLLIAAGLVLFATTGFAQTLDDPPVWVYGTNCDPNTSNCFVYGNEVNNVTTNDLVINMHGAANDTVKGTFLLIMGIPTGGGSAPTPNSPLLQGNGGTSIYGWNGNFSGGTFTDVVPFGTSSLDVCSFLTLTPVGGCNSETLGNWQNASKAVLGTTPSGFSIYVYELQNISVNGKGQVDVSFSTNIPTGTFLAGYGCADTPATPNGGNCSTGNLYVSPFTNAGLETNNQVPEPASLALFGTGLAAIAGIIRRRRANYATGHEQPEPLRFGLFLFLSRLSLPRFCYCFSN